ncbi:MAG: hypothetical protein NTV87_02735 [Ignavibacteriae bacterium]|nr:hypothetical protein [Ignavibacteriota bacterium]
MFPEYCNEHPAVDVFGFNGFETIPAYRKMDVTDSDGLKQVSVKIRRLGENSCGFIENGKINFHTCDEDAYFINMDNEFVYAYFKDKIYHDYMPVLMILDFLKYKSRKLMLVYEDTFFVIEKTDDTYKICEKLDVIYSSGSFLREVFIRSISEDNYENIFHKLLEIYSMRYLDRDIRNYKLFDVLLKVLKLEIQ